MGAMTQGTVPQILKELYDNQKVHWLTFKDNPTYAMLHKEEKFPGKFFPQPVVYGLSGGVSATFGSAFANQQSPNVAEFLVTRTSDFSIATVTLVAANTYAVLLVNPDDAVQFEKGLTLVSVQFVDGTGLMPVDAALITAVNRNTGVLTVTSLTNLVVDWPALYFLAVQGDLPNAVNFNFQPIGSNTTNSLLRIAGFAAWLPLAGPPLVDSFFGVNRNLDTQRLAGVTFDGTALSMEEASLQGTGRIALNGGRVDTGIASFATYTAIIISLGSKVQYIDEKIGEIGFRGVQVNGANTVVSIFPDRSCPDGVIYFLELDSWTLRSQNPSVHILKYMDEIEILRIPGADSAELRVGGYKNLYTNRMGHNGVVAVQLQEF